MSRSTGRDLNALPLKNLIRAKTRLQFPFSMLFIATLPILISTKAYQLILLSNWTDGNHSCVLKTTTDRDDFLLLAVEALDQRWLFDYLLCVSAWNLTWPNVNASLKVSTCSPTVHLMLAVYNETVSRTRNYLRHTKVLDRLDQSRLPPSICVSMSKLP